MLYQYHQADNHHHYHYQYASFIFSNVSTCLPSKILIVLFTSSSYSWCIFHRSGHDKGLQLPWCIIHLQFGSNSLAAFKFLCFIFLLMDFYSIFCYFFLTFYVFSIFLFVLFSFFYSRRTAECLACSSFPLSSSSKLQIHNC